MGQKRNEPLEQEVFAGLLIVVVMAAVRKATAGLKYAASGEYQDYPPGLLELGVALDAISLVANDVLECIRVNTAYQPDLYNPNEEAD